MSSLSLSSPSLSLSFSHLQAQKAAQTKFGARTASRCKLKGLGSRAESCERRVPKFRAWATELRV